MYTIPLAGWEAPVKIIRAEARQLIEEGREPQWIEKIMKSVDMEMGYRARHPLSAAAN
jgi:hypothetical protein